MSDMSGTRYCVGEFGMSTKFFKNYVALAGPSFQREADDWTKWRSPRSRGRSRARNNAFILATTRREYSDSSRQRITRSSGKIRGNAEGVQICLRLAPFILTRHSAACADTNAWPMTRLRN